MKNLFSFFIAKANLLSALVLIGLMSINITQAQVINGGFESNNSGNPMGWSLGGQFGAGIDTNSARSGNNSLSVWNWYYYSPGYAINGTLPQFSINYHLAGMPIANKPISLDGYYTYDSTNTSSTNDSAIAWVLLKKFNVALHKVDTVGFGMKKLAHTPGSAFEPFQVMIQDLMPGIMPDSVVIFFQSATNGFCANTTNGNCLYLNVDDLAFDTPASTNPKINLAGLFSVFPNPAQHEFTVQNYSGNSWQLCLMNTSGAEVLTQEVKDETARVQTQNLPAGFYVLKLTDHNGNVINKKLLVQH